MSLIPEIKDGQLCERCHLHKATLVASESTMDYIHGFLVMWCRCCHLDVEIKRVEKAMERYPQLLKDQDAACRDEPPHDPQALLASNADLRSETEAQWTAAHCMICGRHYPHRQNAMNYAAPHPEGEHCYWPRPEVLE